MNRGWLSLALGCLMACAVWAGPACQQSPKPPGDWQQQMDDLRQQVAAMQKDLDEIKALLAPLRARQSPPGPPAGARLDLGNRPVKGSPAAKVTLVELTDYQ